MNGITNWINNNVDRKQLTTIVAASIVVGGIVYAAKATGMGSIATVVKGG